MEAKAGHGRRVQTCPVRQAIIFLQHTHRETSHTHRDTHTYSYIYSYRYLNVSRYLLKRCKAKAKRIEGVKWAWNSCIATWTPGQSPNKHTHKHTYTQSAGTGLVYLGREKAQRTRHWQRARQRIPQTAKAATGQIDSGTYVNTNLLSAKCQQLRL